MAGTTGLTASPHSMAGGGVKGGTSYGETDDRGRLPTEGKPIKPEDLNATIAYLLGLTASMMFNTPPPADPLPIAHKGEPSV